MEIKLFLSLNTDYSFDWYPYFNIFAQKKQWEKTYYRICLR